MNADYELIKNIEKSISGFDENVRAIGLNGIEYPLDDEVRQILFSQIVSNENADEFDIYKRVDVVKKLWAILIKNQLLY